MTRRKTKPTRAPRPTFSSVFPTSGYRVDKHGTPWWRVRGSGVCGSPLDSPSTSRIAELLERHGIKVIPTCIMGMCCADQYELEVPFLDGALLASNGNYIGAERSGWVKGAKAALFVALGLGLRVSDSIRARYGLPNLSLEELERELQHERQSKREKAGTAAGAAQEIAPPLLH